MAVAPARWKFAVPCAASQQMFAPWEAQAGVGQFTSRFCWLIEKFSRRPDEHAGTRSYPSRQGAKSRALAVDDLAVILSDFSNRLSGRSAW